MSEDKELEYLKRKRLLEMQKRLLVEKAAEIAQKEKKEEQKPKDPKDVLKIIFADDAWKIWQAAEKQYPQAVEKVAKTLADLYGIGKIREKITGEQLYWLFSELGLQIRIETKIRILDKGKMKTIADKLRE
ncbi:MAG: DNA-binding protein [Candidatus Bathyarchaeota archaeon]